MTSAPRSVPSVRPDHPGMFTGPSESQGLLEWVLLPLRAYLVLPVVFGVVAVLVSLLVPNKYRAAAQFYPEQRTPSTANLGAFAGLASQLGVGLAGGAQSPQFYVQVLASQRLLEGLLTRRVQPAGKDSLPLLDYLDDDGGPITRARLERGTRRLRAVTEATVNPRTNIIELAVTLEDRDVAAQAVRLYLTALNEFNLETRQSQAGQRRRFTQFQLQETQDSLLDAERAVRDFLTRNRQYRDSPTLSFEYDRLQRQVANYQTLYTGLRRDYDTARLDEVNDTPVLTLVDPPTPPVRKSSPHRALAGIGAGLAGVLVTLLWAALRAFLGRLKREQPDRFDLVAGLAQRFRLHRPA